LIKEEKKFREKNDDYSDDYNEIKIKLMQYRLLSDTTKESL
jgi:hypothetical protein